MFNKFASKYIIKQLVLNLYIVLMFLLIGFVLFQNILIGPISSLFCEAILKVGEALSLLLVTVKAIHHAATFDSL